MKMAISLLFIASAAAESNVKPLVLTSIKPLALITQELTAGMPVDVDYLLPPTVSEHSYALKFSDIRKLQDAALVIWLDKDMEPYLYSTQGRWLKMSEPGKSLMLLPLMALETESKEMHEADEHGHIVDPHVWLSPLLAVQVAELTYERLSEQFPENKLQLEENLAIFKQKVANVDEAAMKALAPYKGQPFLVYHEAYGYYVMRYELNQIGALHTQPGAAMTLRQLAMLKGALEQQNRKACLFHEPQFEAAALPAFKSQQGVIPGVLDPLGIKAASYFEMMENLTTGMIDCFEKASPEKKKA